VLKKLQPLPPIATQLMNMVSDGEVAFGRMAEKIKLDPAFSAEVLTLANSPLIGCRGTVNNILHAVALLGLERMKSLVLMVALRNFLSRALEVPALERCWRHSLACAFLAEEIAAATCWMDRDQCYTAGLMHDIGRLALLANHPAEYARVIECVDRTGCDILECEREIFGIDHREAGRQLMIEWNFPPLFAEVASRHTGQSENGFDARAIVLLSCEIANLLGFQVAGPAPEGNADLIRAKLPEPLRRKMSGENDLLEFVSAKINALQCSFTN